MNRSSDVAIRSPRILSLCSGIAGLDLGVRAALRENCRTVCMVERETYCAAVLAERMQEGKIDDAPIWSDIATFDPQPWRGKVDAIIGGYPCQSISHAGQRKGTADKRWLWPHFKRIIGVIRPTWCFFENVAQHVFIGLKEVWTDLQAMGFDVEAGLFEAAESGARHIRRRLFIFAYSNRLWKLQQKGGLSQERRRACNSGRWPAIAGVCRTAHGVPNGVDRLRALGNAVVPQCATYAFLTLTGHLTDD